MPAIEGLRVDGVQIPKRAGLHGTHPPLTAHYTSAPFAVFSRIRCQLFVVFQAITPELNSITDASRNGAPGMCQAV